MQSYVNDLRGAVEGIAPLLREMDEALSKHRPAPGKWSPREIVGHLIDSASVNHEGFVRAAFQESLVFPGYDQEAWVTAQRYQDVPLPELATLWRALNRHIARVMESTPSDARLRLRAEHNLHEIGWKLVPEDQPTTLDYLMEDYVGHLKHHLAQITQLAGGRSGS